MDDISKKYLLDMITSIDSINSFVITNNFIEYSQNKLVMRAVEREFEIIGEALNKFLKLNPTIEINQSKKIIGLRNLIIHAYDSVDHAFLWGIIKLNLPDLKKELASIINQ